MLKFKFLFLVVLFSRIANPAVQDEQIWGQVIVTGPLINHEHPLRLYIEYQSRHSEDLPRTDLAFLRPAIMYKYNSDFTFAFGALSLRGFDFNEVEERLWQQVQFFKEIEYASIQFRGRLEQRFRKNSLSSGQDDSQILHRIRLLLRFQPKSTIGFGFKPVLINEFMINLNDSSSFGYNKIRSGYDQNRTFVGINKEFNKKWSTDFGYFHVDILKGTRKTFLINGVFLNLYLKL